MKKIFFIILVFLVSESAFAADYVNLTDYDVKRFIVLVNEIAPELKKSNGDYNIEYFEKNMRQSHHFKMANQMPC